MCNIELHNHSHYSNLKLLDSTNLIDELIQTASDMGKKGLAITEHESVASSFKAIETTKKLKDKGKIPKDFKLILGNEIYLVESLELVRDNYESGVTKFPHFLLLAKDAKAHEVLRELSSKAWDNMFKTGMMERTPTIKKDLEEAVRNNPEKIIATTACLGSESSIHILNGDFKKAKEFLMWCYNLFGKDHFYLEMQPCKDGEQRIVNEKLVEFSEELGIDLVITSDTHYLRPEDASIHESFLNAKQGDREVASFYANTYLHTQSEIYDKLEYLDESVITKALNNTIKIGDMIEEYTLEHETIIPRIELPKFEVKHLFKEGYSQYKYIKNMAYSKDEQDKYYLSLIENGFIEYIPYKTMTKVEFHRTLARIDIELKQLLDLSIKLNQTMSSYYVTVARVVELMWNDDDCEGSKNTGSLVGSGRGSAVAWLTNYLTGITQVNPLAYGIEIPFWRHLSAEMASISSLDIDLDINGSKKNHIFNRIKNDFGEERFLQVCTFGTEGSKSALQTACRGIGIDMEVGQYLSSLVPFDRGENWSIKDCIEGNEEKERKPIKEFISEIEKYPKLKSVSMKIEGLINKRSIHAGGVLILNDAYTKNNASMRAPNGSKISQFNLEDSQKMGGIKYDILTIESLQKIQTTMDYLLEEGLMEWQGSLRKTFNKYLHPEVIDKENPKLFEMASSGEVLDLFQFSTDIGHSTITKAKPTNLIEMTASNSLMRLQTNGEQPIDTFVRFKEDIAQWYDEMREYKLTEDEVKVMEDHLLPLNGVADTQESVMLMAMDDRVSGFNIAEATFLRKSIAAKSDDIANEIKNKIFDKGREKGTSDNLLNYLWYQISRMLSYAFSSPHTLAYSLIAMEQLNLNYNYNPLYWQTAVLTVNSGSQEVDEGEKSKSTDYGKIATAIGELRSQGINIELPLINSSTFGFKPDVKNDRILYSLKGINSIGDEVVNSVIENRPYQSFSDFHDRLYKTKILQRSHVLQLIKAGSFNEFNSPVEIMKEFIAKEVDVKTELNGQNMTRIIKLGLFNNEKYIMYQDYFNFRKHIKKIVNEVLVNPKNRILEIKDDYSKIFFEGNFSDKSVVRYSHGGSLLIDENVFEKEYKEKMLPTATLLEDKNFIREFNLAQFRELWSDLVKSYSVEKWEMESVSFYSNKHELDYMNRKKYGVVSYFDLPSDPIITDEYEWRGRPMKNYKLDTIVGTVVDKNKNSHTVSILTPEGVVTCKQWGGSFSHYDRQIKINGKIEERSWFTRGQLLMFQGYRRGDQFFLKAPKGQHAINKITEIREDGSVGLQNERIMS